MKPIFIFLGALLVVVLISTRHKKHEYFESQSPISESCTQDCAPITKGYQQIKIEKQTMSPKKSELKIAAGPSKQDFKIDYPDDDEIKKAALKDPNSVPKPLLFFAV